MRARHTVPTSGRPTLRVHLPALAGGELLDRGGIVGEVAEPGDAGGFVFGHGAGGDLGHADHDRAWLLAQPVVGVEDRAGHDPPAGGPAHRRVVHRDLAVEVAAALPPVLVVLAADPGF